MTYYTPKLSSNINKPFRKQILLHQREINQPTEKKKRQQEILAGT